jgi:serine/threonine-protein kinase
MGVVWLATNESTGGEVALKLVVRPEPELRHRLLREARACCSIRHRNVIQIHDVGQTDGGDPFLVMELLCGETLADLLSRRRRLSQEEAASIGRDIARALAAAHEKDIVHRDLKPANVFLHDEPGADGHVIKVLDFGVSKSPVVSDGMRTVTGGAVGSPMYMSPEQAKADPTIDGRSDIWSLGVVLFEMLAGQKLFTGEGVEIVQKVLTAEIPSLSRRVRKIDPSLDQLIVSCLQRRREDRPWPASEIAKRLEVFAAPAGRTPLPSVSSEARGAADAAAAAPSRASSPSGAAVLAPTAPLSGGDAGPFPGLPVSDQSAFQRASDHGNTPAGPAGKAAEDAARPIQPAPADEEEDDDGKVTVPLDRVLLAAVAPRPAYTHRGTLKMGHPWQGAADAAMATEERSAAAPDPSISATAPLQVPTPAPEQGGVAPSQEGSVKRSRTTRLAPALAAAALLGMGLFAFLAWPRSRPPSVSRPLPLPPSVSAGEAASPLHTDASQASTAPGASMSPAPSAAASAPPRATASAPPSATASAPPSATASAAPSAAPSAAVSALVVKTPARQSPVAVTRPCKKCSPFEQVKDACCPRGR